MINLFPNPKTIAQPATLLAIVLIASVLAYSYLMGPVHQDASLEEVIVSPEFTLHQTALLLKDRGIIRSTSMFEWSYITQTGYTDVRPGVYNLSASMDLRTLSRSLSQAPYLAWVTISPGYRKEQIAELLAEAMYWTQAEKEAWLAEASVEGVYFPSTYMIPTDESPAAVAARMRSRFEEAFLPYAIGAKRSGKDWNEVLTIASMIEREAAGPHDMNLIAGIIYNRLEEGMPLGIDATLQYIRGEEGRWWPVPKSEDKYLESPYNTYFKAGLPPGPIATPSVDAVAAVLNPESTNCFYYLHDYRGRIHCSTNYKAHVANVDRYLR